MNRGEWLEQMGTALGGMEDGELSLLLGRVAAELDHRYHTGYAASMLATIAESYIDAIEAMAAVDHELDDRLDDDDVPIH